MEFKVKNNSIFCGIYLKNGLGMTIKTYPYTLKSLRFEKNRFWIGDTKLRVTGWLLEKKSLNTFLEYLEKQKQL
jgi:hypothetical protein